jgi:hypothetical protein
MLQNSVSGGVGLDLQEERIRVFGALCDAEGGRVNIECL